MTVLATDVLHVEGKVAFHDNSHRRLVRTRVWEQFLTEAERQLPLRHYAVAAISMMETSAQLQSLHRPWLAALRLNTVT